MNYDEEIKSFLKKRNIKHDKNMINIIKNISSLDTSICKDIKKNKKDKLCIAYAQEPILCLSKGKDKIIKSHVVPENQISKFIEAYGEIRSFSFSIFNKINDFPNHSSTSSPDFIGFCESCEKSFTQAHKINIDSEVNFKKEHLLKSLYRYMGKEITYRESYLKHALFIINDDDKFINKDDFEYFNINVNGYNNNDYIVSQTHYLRTLKNLFFDLGIYSSLPQHSIPKNTSDVFSFDKIKISNKYQIIGQSLGLIPLYYKDYNAYFPVFFNIVYDDKNKCSYFYFLTRSDILIQIKKIVSQLTINQKELFYIILAIFNSSEIYFTDSFLNNHYPLIEKIISNIKMKNLGFFDEIKELSNNIKNTLK